MLLIFPSTKFSQIWQYTFLAIYACTQNCKKMNWWRIVCHVTIIINKTTHSNSRKLKQKIYQCINESPDKHRHLNKVRCSMAETILKIVNVLNYLYWNVNGHPCQQFCKLRYYDNRYYKYSCYLDHLVCSDDSPR